MPSSRRPRPASARGPKHDRRQAHAPSPSTPARPAAAAREKNTISNRAKAILDQPGGTLILLRAFLGGTFVFAGLEKLANPNFYKTSASASFAAQVRGAILTSPLHGALQPALHAPVLFALLVSLGELAVGLGTLSGLYGKVAAGGGMLLSMSFFLTVSFHDSPYYYGADIVFLFAWTPFLLGGSGELSLDAILARRRPSPAQTRGGVLDRRAVLTRVGAATGLGVFALVLAAIDYTVGSHLSRKPDDAGTGTTVPGHTTTTAAPIGETPTGTPIGLATAIPVGGALAFTDQKQGIPGYCVHISAGDFIAFSAICTHAGCTVGFDDGAKEFVCPCHGSIYNALTGAVIQGPAVSPLPSIAVKMSADGTLYATD